MENTQQQILSEIKALMSSVRMQLEQLDAKMAELQQSYEPQELEAEPLDLELDAFSLEIDDDLPSVAESEAESPQVCEPAAEQEVEVEEVEETPSYELAEAMAELEEEPEDVEEKVEDVETDLAEEEPLFAPIEEDLPAAVEPTQTIQKAATVIDAMTTRHAWRHDMPGTPVKDIRAAIALVDRALFINSLFGEDAMAFLETLNHINQVASLDEAVEYLVAVHPEWDFDSDVVYRFMMAVRRKIN